MELRRDGWIYAGVSRTATSATAKDSPAMVTERSVGSEWLEPPREPWLLTGTSPSVGFRSANSASPWYTSNTSWRVTQPVRHAMAAPVSPLDALQHLDALGTRECASGGGG